MYTKMAMAGNEGRLPLRPAAETHTPTRNGIDTSSLGLPLTDAALVAAVLDYYQNQSTSSAVAEKMQAPSPNDDPGDCMHSYAPPTKENEPAPSGRDKADDCSTSDSLETRGRALLVASSSGTGTASTVSSPVRKPRGSSIFAVSVSFCADDSFFGTETSDDLSTVASVPVTSSPSLLGSIIKKTQKPCRFREPNEEDKDCMHEKGTVKNVEQVNETAANAAMELGMGFFSRIEQLERESGFEADGGHPRNSRLWGSIKAQKPCRFRKNIEQDNEIVETAVPGIELGMGFFSRIEQLERGSGFEADGGYPRKLRKKQRTTFRDDGGRHAFPIL